MKQNRFMLRAMRVIAERGGTYLQGEYRNAKSPLVVNCHNGHVFKTNWDRLKQEKWCRSCPRPSRLGYTITDMQRIAQENGGECLSPTYSGLKIKLRWNCHFHGEFAATPSNVIYGKSWCPTCGKSKKRRESVPLTKVEEYVKAKNGSIARATGYMDSRSEITVRCGNGHLWPVTATSLVHQNSWCPQCFGFWQGEEICRVIFQASFGIKFPKCRPRFLGGRLELDGFSEELKLAFEYQGPQHMRPDQRARDQRKRRLCAIQNIQLVEIEYLPKPSITELLPRIAQALTAMGVEVTVKAPDAGLVLFPEKLKELNNHAKSKGGLLKSKDFRGENSKHEWKCRVKSHKTWLASPYNVIKKGTWCPACSRCDKKDTNWLKARGSGLGLRLLSEKYEGANSSYWWECAARKHKFSAPIGNLQKRWDAGRLVCTECSGTSRISVDVIDDWISPRNWLRISKHYESPHTSMTFRCSNGHEFERTWNKLQQGYGCRTKGCADNKKQSPIDRIKIS